MISMQSAVVAEALPDRVLDAQRAVSEIRGISVATMSELRSTVRRLRSLESMVESPASKIFPHLPSRPVTTPTFR
jgi:signal transduction histidine kinase